MVDRLRFGMKTSNAAIGILIAGLLVFCVAERQSIVKLRAQNQAQRQELVRLGGENERLSNRLSQGASDVAQPPQRDHLTELLRLRNEVAMLRTLTNSPDLVACGSPEMSVGSKVKVQYDPAKWRPFSSTDNASVQSTTWETGQSNWVQVTVGNDSATKSEVDYKRDIIEAQSMRGQPAELIDERHESWGGREWLVLDFRNLHFQPPRREIRYFLSDGNGHITLFVVAEEPSLVAQQDAIEAFLRQIRIQ